MSVDQEVTPRQREIYQELVEFVYLCIREVEMPSHTIVRVAFDSDPVPSYCDTSKLDYNTVFVNITASGETHEMITSLAKAFVRMSPDFSMATVDVAASVSVIQTLHLQAMTKSCRS